jgi:G:T-mismatch repair DNA endonuclease (very short patch repair protein)
VTRDRIAIRGLRQLGWRVLIVWECELKEIDKLGRKLHRAIAGGVN